jgi:hypothetical protein
MWKKQLIRYTPILLGAILFLLPFERIPSFDVAAGSLSVTVRLSQLVGLALWAVALLTLDPARLSVEQAKKLPAYVKLIVLFLFTTLLSSLAASFSLKRALIVWVFTLFTIGVGLLVGRYFKPKDVPIYIRCLALGTWVVVIFGFYQFFGDILGLSNSATGLRDLYTYSVLGFTRVQSTALEPLYLANFLLIPLFIFLAQYVYGLKKRPWLLALGTVIFTLTVSRGAYISAVCGLGVFVVLILWRKKKLELYNCLQAALLVVFGVSQVLLFAFLTF